MNKDETAYSLIKKSKENIYDNVLNNAVNIEAIASIARSSESSLRYSKAKLRKKQELLVELFKLMEYNLELDRFSTHSKTLYKEFQFLVNQYKIKNAKKAFFKIRKWISSTGNRSTTTSITSSEDLSFMNWKEGSALYFMISIFSYSELNHIIDICIQKNIDIHEFTLSLQFPNRKYITEIPRLVFSSEGMEPIKVTKEFHDELYSFIINVLNTYESFKVFQLLTFSNYHYIRSLENNYNDMEEHISRIQSVRNPIIIINGDETTSAYKENNLFDIDEIGNMIDMNSVHSTFSHDKRLITSIGRVTLCCFTPNGLAKDLVKASVNSPIAGIIYGAFGKKRWFSFVWEIVMLRKSEETGESYLETCLVLDNIESNQRLTAYEYEKVAKELRKTRYKTFYLGTLRNDIDGESLASMFDTSNVHTKKYSLIYFNTEFGRYTFDDSKHLYQSIPSFKYNIPVDLENRIIEKVTDIRWYHRLSYLSAIDPVNNVNLKWEDFLDDKIDCFIERDSVNIFKVIVRSSNKNTILTFGDDLNAINSFIKEYDKPVVVDNKVTKEVQEELDRIGELTDDELMTTNLFKDSEVEENEEVVLEEKPMIIISKENNRAYRSRKK